MKKQTRKRAFILISSIILSMSMIASIMPQGTIKADEEIPVSATPYEDMKKEHEHDEDCGYVEAKEGIPCDHVHDENCGEMDEMGNYPDCQHNHKDCSYQDFIEGQPCNITENKIPNTENSIQLMQVNDVVVEEVEITFDDDIENAMTTAIAKSMEGKSENEIKAITTIKVIGNASAITDKNWKALLKLYIKDSGYPSLNTLDLSSMYSLKKIASSMGATISPTQLTTVSLPDTLTEIGHDAFFYCKNLNISQLPRNLEIIGNGAFYGCSSLSLTELPDTITSIESYAFSNCKNLNIKSLPKGIKYIAVQTFLNSGITEIVIPSNVEWIGSEAFLGCKNLNKITFEGSKAPTLNKFEDLEGVFTDIAKNGEIIYPYNVKEYETIKNSFMKDWEKKYNILILDNNIDTLSKVIADLTINEKDKKDITTIRVIGDAVNIEGNDWLNLIKLFDKNSGYSDNLTLDLSEMSNLQTIGNYEGLASTSIKPSKLKEVKLPNSLKTIERYTFSGCTNLTTINLSDGLKKIGESAFYDCVLLELDKLPDSIEEIRSSAFFHCQNISLTTLPNSLTTLGQSAFTGCTQLAITELPKGIKVIDSQTFSGTGIKELVIHEGITDIEAYAFSDCLSLSKITFMGDIRRIVDTAFSKVSLTGKAYYNEGASGYERLSQVLPEGWDIIMIKKPTPSGSSSSHSHYYGKQWKSDEINHWHECSCGKQKDVEAHEYSEWIEVNEEHGERECLICGYIQKETFTHRQLTDALTGVQLSGTMSESTKLVVSESPIHAAGLCSACDEIRSLMSEGKLIKAYEISLVGDYKGELTLSFPMDPKYNGESFMLYHYAEDGRVDQLINVNNGMAEGKVHSLSPFAIVRSNETITQQVSLNQGESITIHPASMDGIWAYDDELIQLTQNGDSFTLTAIKEGSTSAVYTTKYTQTIVDVNIPASHVPNTNDSIRGYMLIAIVSLCGLVLLKMNQRKID